MNRHIGYIQLTALWACLLALTGCTAEDSADPRDDIFGNGIKVSARIADHVYTRMYQEEGPVESGKYYLSYPSSTGNKDYTIAVVDFDQQKDITPGLGIVSTLAGGELKWSDVSGSPVNFYLDNVGQEYGTTSTVTFKDSDNPFVAGLFDSKDGKNDLLWGEKAANSGTKSLSFDLHHNMSRVRVKVEVYHKDYTVEEITLKGATVKITNLYPTPASYNRLDGSLTLKDDLSDVTVVSPEAPGYEGYDWAKSETTDEVSSYLSQDIVLPPQSLAEDGNRPKLEITLADGSVYSGILPHAMMIAQGNDPSLSYPVTLSFLKEYILTIHTVITEQPPELAFMPVWVTEWVDKGEFTLEAHQAGIYSPSEFYNLTRYYGALNEYQLARYGYYGTPENQTDKVWIFNIFNSLELDFNRIYGSMIPNSEIDGKGKTKDFIFQFNNYSVSVYNGTEDNAKQVNPEKLRGIVTGALTWEKL